MFWIRNAFSMYFTIVTLILTHFHTYFDGDIFLKYFFFSVSNIST